MWLKDHYETCTCETRSYFNYVILEPHINEQTN